ncbi:MAG TPA: Stk1 family PASTA domain-containing Ser/Thr kinase [Gaiellaceae bacterium]|jgi:serine/threonine-protein kinase|nr:Stk1 family PASTA domain-containing Ser/Thr kinase [Gaiellaceae bacterium]
MATDVEDRLIGSLFDGRYRIVRKLGSGGMAEVYLAEDEELGRKVALKMLDERHARDEQFVERFKREARNAAGLSHPHIVRIYDRGQAEGTYYIAMEYLDGPTLKELLVRKGPTPPLTAIKFAREILSALAEAHKHDIVHRDIKPHNVIVSPDWNVKVTDFGIARSGASQMTEAGSIVGTAQYLSPEQARGKPVDQRSDLYSLGIVLYEMLTGRVPFTGDAAVEIAMKHLSAIPEPPSKLRPEVSHDLDAVVMRALAKDPADRYSSAEEMDADLARVARGASVSTRTEEAMTSVLAGSGVSTAMTSIVPREALTPPPAPPPYRPPSYYEDGGHRRSRWPMILGLFAIAVIAVGGYLIYERVNTAIDTNKTVAVTNVVQTPVKNAEFILHQQGLLTTTEETSSATVAKDLVISQNPNPGTRVAKQTTVNLTVSTGVPKTTVPTVVNLPASQAQAELTSKGLKSVTHDVPSGAVPSGNVTAASPPAGTTVLVGSQVVLNVSTGPKQAGVPSVVGDPYANAEGALKGAGFKVNRTDEGNSAAAGTVVSQDPGGGTSAAAGSTVTLVVSTGPELVSVPSVTQDDQTTATQLLQAAGFSVSVVQQDVTDPTQDKLVLAQDPAANKKVQQNTTVTINVGHLVTAPPTDTSTTTTTTGTTTTTDTTTTTPATSTTPTATTPTTPLTGGATPPAGTPPTTPP